MQYSEELMVLLELNGYDVSKFKLKKHLEFEKTGNIDLYRHKKLADLLISHYSYVENADYYHRNPLTYKEDWPEEVKSLDQFYVRHHDLDGEKTLKEFLEMDEFNQINREAILYDIFDGWVEEYREASVVQMENLRTMVSMLPKKGRKYRKPSRMAFFFATLLALLLILLYKNPGAVQPKIIPFISNFMTDLNALLYESTLYSFVGLLSILFLVTFAVLSNALSMFVRDVRGDNNKHAMKTFDKWDNDMKNKRLDQSGHLEDYVDVVITKPKKSHLDIKLMGGPEKLMRKFKDYVKLVEKRFDFMKKHYETIAFVLRLIFLGAILFNLGFYIFGFLLTRGIL